MRKKTWIYTCILGVVMIFAATGCKEKSNVKQPYRLGTEDSGKGIKDTICVQSVIKEINTKDSTISLYDISSGMEKTVKYNRATQVYSRNKVAMLVSQLECGEIVDAFFEGNDEVVAKLQVSKDAWEYKKVKAIDLDRTNGIVTLTGRKYNYQKDVAVFYGTQQQMLIDLNERDEITVKGIGDRAYSFMITKGHGYIRLGGHEKFIGGEIAVDKNIFLPIEQNMLITVGEGDHTIVVDYKNVQIVETIHVERNQEYFFDMSTYEIAKKEMGQIRFVISPSDATLYINGKKKNYLRPISLAYGNYTVRVCAEGYEDYTGILHVKENSKDYETIYVNLVAKENEKATQTPKPTAAPTLSPGTVRTAKPVVTQSAEEAGQPTRTDTPTDKEHKMNIIGPLGASVYIDGVYKGVAPLEIDKVLGDVTVTLSKDGYQTKSYSLTIEDDSEDVEFSFAELLANEK